MPPGSNNPFGIKALPGQASVSAKTQEFVNGVEGTYLQNFRAFDSLTDAFNSHGLLIATGKPYQTAFEQYEQDHNVVALIKGVAARYATARYATAPTYAERLITLLQEKPVQQALVFAKIAAGVPA
jgi:flagellum-specific peptidoglycan hydrolase FlgJ